MRKLLLLSICLSWGACASSPDLVVLMNPLGDTPQATVTQGAETRTLTQPLDTVELHQDTVRERQSSQTEIEEIFGSSAGNPSAVVARQERVYVVPFGYGDVLMSEDGQRVIKDVVEDIKQHGAKDVLVEGHTDTKGSASKNMALSLKRAAAVTEALKERGVAVNIIQISGLGETQPIVATGEGVSEPQNRRVVITVR